MAGPTEIAGEIFGRLRGIAKQIVEGDSGIFKELAKEHGEVSVLMKRVSASDDPDVRREHFPKIREELLAHAKAEEREFYPLLQNHDEARLLVEQALLDHKEIEQMIEAIHALDYSDPSWDELFKKLEGAVETHVEMEENEIFAKAKDIFSKDDSQQILEQFQATRSAEKAAMVTLH